MLIGCLIMYSSWGLVKEGVDILMEARARQYRSRRVAQRPARRLTDTEELHDLHVWCLTSREFALSAHAVVAPGADQDRVLSEMSQVLEHKFKIRHMTVQLERDNRRPREPEHF